MPDVTITYFQPDECKAGGTYLSVTGRIRKTDAYEKSVVMMDKQTISIEEILRIGGSLFSVPENISI